MAGIQATGLGSNLDVGGLVDKLMTIEQVPVDKMNAKIGATQVKVSAYGSFRSVLSQFQATLKSLADPTNFKIGKASVEDPTVATASASATADPGSYSLEVTALAKAQKLSSGGVFSAITDVVGTGTLSIQYGTYDPAGAGSFTLNGDKGTQTIEIDPAHSTLAGVRDAINAAKGGVSASIINDGSGFRLVVSARDTGAANSLKISVTDGDLGNSDASGLSTFAYDPTAAVGSGKNMSQLMAAQNATLLVDGLLVSKASNTITDVIGGTTLSLLKTNIGTPTKFTVSADTAVAQTAVDNFVKSYNELNKTINDLTKFGVEAKDRGPLQGDATLRSVASDIRNGLTAIVSGAVGIYKALPQVGLTFDRNGALSVDSVKLQAALKADPIALQSLFANAGVTDDPLVSYAGSTSASKPGSYTVNVSQLATRGSLVGSAAAGLTIDGTNDTLSFSINGVATSVKLAQKTYASHSALIAELQSKVNGSSTLVTAGASVNVSAASGVLTLASVRYGSASTVAITGGTGAEYLFGTTPTLNAGVDVAGTFGDNAGVGSGQRLTGTGSTDGLKADVLGGATGERGTLRYGVGIAGNLDAMITKLLSAKGLIAAKNETMAAQVKQYTAQVTTLEARIEVTRARYTKQFNSLDSQLSAMQSTSAYLAQQLASLQF